MDFYYITGNKAKIASAQKYLAPFGIEFEVKKLDLLEPQSSSAEEISKFKAKQAFDILNAPVIVNDVEWSIPALNGFPGPYAHDIFEWLTPDDILNLMKEKEDRTLLFTTVMVYRSKDDEKVFKTERQGRLLKKRQGKAVTPSIPVDEIMCFRDDDISFAECRVQNIPLFSAGNDSIWEEAGKWLKEKKEANK